MGTRENLTNKLDTQESEDEEIMSQGRDLVRKEPKIEELRKGISEICLTLIKDYQIRLPKSEKTEFKEKLDEVITIIPGEYATISKYTYKKVVNTLCVEDSFAVSLYDSERQVASLAHICNGTKVEESIYNMIKNGSSFGGNNYTARIFGGYNESATQMHTAIRTLEKNETILPYL